MARPTVPALPSGLLRPYDAPMSPSPHPRVRRAHVRRLLPALILASALFVPAAGSQASGLGPQSVVTYGYGNAHTGYNPAENALGASNAPGLTQLWSFDIGGATISEPMLAAGVQIGATSRDLVLDGSENGTLYAVDAESGSQVWQRDLGAQNTGCQDMPGGVFGLSSTPVIDPEDGAVFVAGGDGKLYGLSLATGATLPGWPQVVTTHPQQEHIYSALTRGGSSGDLIYVETASHCDAKPYHGRIQSFSISMHRRIASWYVVGNGSVSGGGIWGQAGVTLDAAGDVFTATGNALTSPETYKSANAMVELSSDLKLQASDHPPLTGFDVDFGASPMLFQPSGCPPLIAVENKSGVLFVYRARSIGAGPVQSLQVGNINDWQFNAIPAWDPVTRLVYVADSSSSTDKHTHVHYREGLIAFSMSGCKLAPTPAWSAPDDPGRRISMSPPTVANGVVYYGDGVGNTVHAYDASTGAPLWDSGSTITGGIWAAPLVANGTLFAGSWDGHLYAFGP